MSTQRIADIIQRAAEAMGYFVRPNWAQTGTIYLELDHEIAPDRKIRIADHSECYCLEDWSVDPDNYSKEQILRFLASDSGEPVPGWVSRNERASAARKAAIGAASTKLHENNRAAEERIKAAHHWLEENEPETWARFYARTGSAGRRFRQAAVRRGYLALGFRWGK